MAVHPSSAVREVGAPVTESCPGCGRAAWSSDDSGAAGAGVTGPADAGRNVVSVGMVVAAGAPVVVVVDAGAAVVVVVGAGGVVVVVADTPAPGTVVVVIAVT